MIVRSFAPVTLLGGAELGQDDLTTALGFAPVLVAADGGAGAALAAGLTPVAVIGDMDSLPAAAAVAFADRLVPISEQDTTDFDKALRHISAPLVLAIGVTGGRFDHELAVLHTLVLRADLPCVVIGAASLVFLCPPRIALDLPTGSVFSLFPLGAVGVVSSGLRWPTSGIGFAPDRVIGTSNAVTGPVTLEADSPLMLVIVPRAALAEVVRALTVAASARWPVRAG